MESMEVRSRKISADNNCIPGARKERAREVKRAQTLAPWARFCTNIQAQNRIFVAQPVRKKKEAEKKKKKPPLYSRDIQ